MGNYKFRLSELIPNAWFYKLKEMTNKTKTTNKNHQTQSSTQPLSSSSSTSASSPQHRKSYYFTRDLKIPLKTSVIISPEKPRKSSKKRRSTKPSHPKSATSSVSVSKNDLSPKPEGPSTTRPHVIVEEVTKNFPPSNALLREARVKSPTSRLNCHNNTSISISKYAVNPKPEDPSTVRAHVIVEGVTKNSPPSNALLSKAGVETSTSRLNYHNNISVSKNGLNPKHEGPTTARAHVIVEGVTKNSPPSNASLHETGVETSTSSQLSCHNSTSSVSLSVSTNFTSSTESELGNLGTVSPIELRPIVTKTSGEKTGQEKRNRANISKEQRTSPVVRRFSGLKLRTNSPRIASKRNPAPARPSSQSFVVVKTTSSDPKRDFRESMVEMIVENKIRGSKELEDLLACYLSLNSDEYYDLIIKVFKQIWFDVFTNLNSN